MQLNVTEQLATFASQTGFADLPHEVIHETKRLLLDILGCAIGSVNLDKGKVAVEFASKVGGKPEASILGTPHKVASPNAAFANGELMHALDYCALVPPNHITALVTPPALALAEARNASGKDLITAVALAHEVASRVGLSLDPMRARKGGLVEPTWGLGFDQFGAAAGAGKILDLDTTAMTDALGLAGYFAPVPSHNKFLLSPQGGGMAKYGPAGWIAQGGVTTAVLASMGYEGDRSVLDGESGFWSMTASKSSDLTRITGQLGKEWNLLRVMYKKWPCCGVFQSPLGAMTKLIEENDLKPDEIQSVLIKNEEHGHLPRFRYGEIHHNVDAATNLEYNIALAAYRVPVSAAWQSERNLKDPRIHAFMKKVTIEPYARAEETRHQELVVERRPYIERRPCSVDVTARGRTFTKTVEHASWLSIDNPAFRATDDDLANKFRANASETLNSTKAAKAIERIMHLENVSKIDELVSELVP